MLSQRLKADFTKLIIRLFTRQISNFYIVFGRRGSGKTDFVLLLSEILHEHGRIKHFATNIKLYGSPFHIERIINLEDLRFWSKEKKGPKLYLLDEVGKTISRRKPMSSLNVELINELQVIRKHKLSLLATTIEEINTDRAILSPAVLDGIFIKPFFKNPKIAYFNDRLGFLSTILKGIPKTAIQYDTWDSAPFQRYGEKRRPTFKTKEKEQAWQLCHGATGKDLDLHPQQVNRVWKKLLKYYMEQEQSQITSN